MPSTIHLIIIVALTIFTVALLFMCSYKMLQTYQLTSYRGKEVFLWLKRTKFDYLARYFSLSFFIFVPSTLFIACFGGHEYVQYLGFIFFALLSILFFNLTRKQTKVSLKFTGRVIRVSMLMIVFYALMSFPLFLLTQYIYLQYSLIGILPLFIPVITALSNALMSPIENAINNGYKKKAIAKLESMPCLTKIGVTGSYGKTTAKNILAVFLSKKYKVCASPKSYNTPMGLTKVINENLSESDEVFIAEMGARYVGDIDELCKLIKPRIGILTAIGDMHLETFGSKENIIKTKYELIDNLSKDGLAIFCGDNEILSELYDKCDKNKYISSSEKSSTKSLYSNVLIDENGISFDLLLDGNNVKINTCLLGEHIPSLITLCALAAYKLGVTAEQIAEAAPLLKQVPHRLELIKEGGSVIIDDAYNSNPDGAKNALKLLSYFEGTKIVITPGMIELGDKSKQIHFDYGAQIAEAADYAILIGRNGSEIKAGIIAAGTMQQEAIKTVRTLDEAMREMTNIACNKKIILFENDLPDNY